MDQYTLVLIVPSTVYYSTKVYTNNIKIIASSESKCTNKLDQQVNANGMPMTIKSNKYTIQ